MGPDVDMLVAGMRVRRLGAITEVVELGCRLCSVFVLGRVAGVERVVGIVLLGRIFELLGEILARVVMENWQYLRVRGTSNQDSTRQQLWPTPAASPRVQLGKGRSGGIGAVEVGAFSGYRIEVCYA